MMSSSIGLQHPSINQDPLPTPQTRIDYLVWRAGDYRCVSVFREDKTLNEATAQNQPWPCGRRTKPEFSISAVFEMSEAPTVL
jgi:hypothetical protein